MEERKINTEEERKRDTEEEERGRGRKKGDRQTKREGRET